MSNEYLIKIIYYFFLLSTEHESITQNRTLMPPITLIYTDNVM